jgi:hypothetical protein
MPAPQPARRFERRNDRGFVHRIVAQMCIPAGSRPNLRIRLRSSHKLILIEVIEPDRANLPEEPCRFLNTSARNVITSSKP